MKEAYLFAMSRAANSVTVVTTDGPAGRQGATVSAMCSVSVDGPAPSLLVCLHSGSRTAQAVAANGAFCANLLTEAQLAISECFAGRDTAPRETKFACANWHQLRTGAPVLNGALAAFDCTVKDVQAVASHQVFIGELQDVECTGTGQPLVYQNRTYGRTQALGTHP